jgi:hypothetical protein
MDKVNIADPGGQRPPADEILRSGGMGAAR